MHCQAYVRQKGRFIPNSCGWCGWSATLRRGVSKLQKQTVSWHNLAIVSICQYLVITLNFTFIIIPVLRVKVRELRSFPFTDGGVSTLIFFLSCLDRTQINHIDSTSKYLCLFRGGVRRQAQSNRDQTKTDQAFTKQWVQEARQANITANSVQAKNPKFKNMSSKQVNQETLDTGLSGEHVGTATIWPVCVLMAGLNTGWLIPDELQLNVRVAGQVRWIWSENRTTE